MQLRMIGRRAPSGSVTVLGDLAQATAAWTHASWADVAAHLERAAATAADGWRSRDLTLGYRVPGPRARLRRAAAPRSRADGGGDGVGSGRPAPAACCSRSPTPTSSRPPPRRPPRSRPRGSSSAASWRPNTKRPRRAPSPRSGVEFGTPERDGILKPITLLPAADRQGTRVRRGRGGGTGGDRGRHRARAPPALRGAHTADPAPDRGARTAVAGARAARASFRSRRSGAALRR